jgi:hypothetical protein
MIDLKVKEILRLPETMGLKPLDCPLCLSFWFGLVAGAQLGGVEAIHTALIAVLFERIIYKQNWL